VTRSRLTWLLFLGLLVGGWAAAHGLAYRIAVPDGDERRHLLEATGHGYLDPAVLVSVSVTLVILGLGGCVLRGRVAAPAPSLFALLPPFAFVVQEHLERLLHTGAFPVDGALEPTFAVGLLLQVPFALAAALVARALLVLTAALAGRLRRSPVGQPRRASGGRGPVHSATLPPVGVLALGHGQRAPPNLLLR
jgi:hypothetical protein